jgi:tRNA U34 5-carboxymethylaminomethyl modifying GTPase MnmE/TrmE
VKPKNATSSYICVMEQLIQVNGVNIRAIEAQDRNGRKGYFIAKTDLPKNKITKALVVSKLTKKINTSPKKNSSIDAMRPEIIELVNEMGAYRDGKKNVRSFDEFIRTV